MEFKENSSGTAGDRIFAMGNAALCNFWGIQNGIKTANGNVTMYGGFRGKDRGESARTPDGKSAIVQRMPGGDDTPIQRMPGIEDVYIARAENLCAQAEVLKQQVDSLQAQIDQNPSNPANGQMRNQVNILNQQINQLVQEAHRLLDMAEFFRDCSQAPSGRSSDDEGGAGISI